MLERVLALGLASLAVGTFARAQLIVAAPGGAQFPVNGGELAAWRVDVATGQSVPLWRGWAEAFAVNDLDGKVFFPSGFIYVWDYDGQSNPVLHGPLAGPPSGQQLPMVGATFALGSLWGVPECCSHQGGLYEIALAPAGQTSVATLRKASGYQFQGLAFNPANGLFYTCVEGSAASAGIWSISLAVGSGPPAKVKSLPTGVTEVGGVAFGGGKLYLTPRGAGSIYIYDIASNQYEVNTLPSPSQAAGGGSAGAGWAPSLIPGNPPPGTFCSPLNSVMGCAPHVGYSGASSASASSGFVVNASGLLQNRPGLMLYQIGGPRNGAPFGSYGTPLCFGPSGIRRSPGMNSGGSTLCAGTFGLDMNAFAAGALGGNPPLGLSVPGSMVFCRFWGRDALQGYVQMSDALEYTVGP